MENKFNRFLSLLLAIVMVIGMIPANVVFAAEDDGASDVTVTEDENENSEKIQTADVTEPITGTITENMTWNDGDVIGGVNISGNVTITVNGTVTVTGIIRLNPDAISNVTFNGENGAKLIRSGEYTGQMFYAEGVSGNFQNLTFNDITLDGGAVWTGDVDKTLNRGKTNEGVKATGSVLYLVYANADLNDSVLQNHDDSTGEKANAVFLRYYSTIDFNNSVVRNNNSVSSYYRGGVITVRQGGIVKTNNTEVYGNFGKQGGFFGTSSTGSYGGIVEVYNSKFHNNYAASGALFDMQCNSNKGYLLIDGCEFYENASGRGLIYEYAYSRPVTIKDSYFHGNECAVWDCQADPVLNLSGKIVIEEDPDYTKYLFETPLVLGAPLAEGSSIPLSEASLTKLGNTIITGTAGYTVTEADLAKLTLPEGYSLYLADTNGDGIGDVVSSNNTTQTAITLTLKDMVDASASEEATVYSDINCLPINPFAHEGLIFAGWIDVNGKTVAKQKFAETMTLTATWKLIAPIAKLSREGATLKVTVTNASDAVTYSYQWYMDDVAIEGATEATYTMTDVNSHTYKCVVTASKEGFESMTGSASGTASAPSVAQVGETNFTSLQAAIAAANAIGGGATITLLSDVTLGEMLTITGNVTISGAHTITRAANYTGTLFAVNAGATLTLDGGLVIDGGNEWTFDEASYVADRDSMTQVTKAEYVVDGVYQKYVTPVANAPVATGHMITVTAGAVNLKNATFQNEYGKNAGVVQALGSGSVVTLEGTKIKHIASMEGNGVAVQTEVANTIIMNAGTIIDGNYVGGNHGMFKLYHGTKMIMNGGEIKNTTGWNSNGTAVSTYGSGSEFIMNDGLICSNSSVWGQDNQRNMAVNVYGGTTMIMNGGTICHNIGKHYAGGIASYKANSNIIIKGGSVVNNISLDNDNRTDPPVERGDDLDTPGSVAISGGTFTQDVSQWCTEGFKVEKNADGTYGVKKDPTYGKVAVIGDQFYETLAEAIAEAEAGATITLIADIEENVTISKNLTIDGANFKYTGTMTLGTVTATVQNVKFVNGEIVKTEKPIEGTFTIKGCSFEGTTSSGYAVKIGNASKLTIEDCTSKDNSFLYIPYSVVALTVKNVTVDNANWAIHLVSMETPVFENVTITNSNCGIVAQNTGNKVVTLNGCSIDAEMPLVVWEKQTNNVTFKFVGANDFGTLKAVYGVINNEVVNESNYDVVKMEAGATLTAAEGLDVTTDVEGCEVEYKDGVYSVVDATRVAQIGETGYKTLQEAINNATAGQTITFLADINENVEITKNVTIDGADKTYTGTMTLTAPVNFTVENVKFVKGMVVKGKNTAFGGTYTFKECEFDGQGLMAYAIDLRATESIVIEDCTVKDYAGFLQVPSSNHKVTVKNVEVDAIYYGFKIDYSGDGEPVYFENVIVNAGEYALYHSNFGAKTHVIKNCTFNGGVAGIQLWNRDTGLVNTFKFVGSNTASGLTSSNYVQYILTEGATLTAPEGATVTTNVEGCEVEYKDGVYSVVDATRVAQIGETKYKTLAEALTYANAGDTITFLADITEDVEITKNVTIDGAGKTYTGKMTLKADTTIKNVNFDGKGYNGYAVETRGANYLTIEDCTAKNYGYGFVQLASATVLTTVKNVTASNMNYGVKIDYSNAVVLENVDITAGVAAVLNSNFGEKTVTIKNSKLNILGTWNRFDKTGVNYVTTYVFEGENSIDQFIIDAAIDTFQLALGATLTAPEGYNVESAEAAYYVDYVEGTYKLVSFVAQNVQTGKYYATVNAALAEADNGETVILIKDVEELGEVSVLEGVTLDLNGKTLIAGYMSSFGDIIDSSEDNTGMLKVNSTRFLIQKDNAQLPVKDGDGYRFVEVLGFNQKVKEGPKYVFQPLFEEDAHNLLLAGQEATGVTVMIRVSWEQTEGTRSQDFVFNDTMVKGFIESYNAETGKYGKQFALTLIGTDAITNLTFTAVVHSSTGVEFTSN